MEQDAFLVNRVLEAMGARQAWDEFKREKGKPSEAQQEMLDRMFDALDERDEAAGIPKEL